MTHSEELELAGLVGQAWELRGSSYQLDACQAITDWHDRRHLRRLENDQERAGRLVRLIRGTYPLRSAA